MFLVLSQGSVLFVVTINAVAYNATHSQGCLKVKLRYSCSIDVTLYFASEIKRETSLYKTQAKSISFNTTLSLICYLLNELLS